MATFAMFQASQRGEFALGGCEVEATSPDWRCARCDHEWADGTMRARVEAVRTGRWVFSEEDDHDDAR